MKKIYFYFVLLNAALLFVSSCKNQDPVSGITLDKTSGYIGLDETLLLNATVSSATGKEVISWLSSDNSVATVTNGLVTPVTAGQVNIAVSDGSNSAACKVTVTQGKSFRACLTGSNYFIISMDNLTAATLGDRVVADYRTDNNTESFAIWDTTYSVIPCTGTNFFGENQSWRNLVVNSVGWSGAHFYCQNVSLLEKFAPIEVNSARYYLHIGIQSSDSTVFLFGLFDEPGMQFAVGSHAFNDNGNMVQALTDFPRDGKWHEIEVPLYELKTEQFQYNSSMGAKNVLWFLSGDVPGTKVNVDALFIYKKP